MSSVFSKIVAGEIPCYKIAETEQFLAFLDIRPQAVGHTLCIPKQEIDYIFDLEPQHLAELMVFSQRVARAIKKVVPCKRIGIAVIGLEVPHAHVHLIPLHSMEDISFKNHVRMQPEEMAALAAKISAAL